MGDAETRRLCSRCGLEKPFTTAAWYSLRGKPVGTVCKPCSKERKRLHDTKARAARVAARALDQAPRKGAVTTPAGKPGAISASRDKLPGENVPLKHLEITQALREGAGVLNRNARRILARVLHYAHSPSSPHHDWALKMLTERIMPSKLFTSIGEQAAGVKAGQGSVKPSVNINITVAGNGGPPQSIAVDVTPEKPDETDGYSRLW